MYSSWVVGTKNIARYQLKLKEITKHQVLVQDVVRYYSGSMIAARYSITNVERYQLY